MLSDYPWPTIYDETSDTDRKKLKVDPMTKQAQYLLIFVVLTLILMAFLSFIGSRPKLRGMTIEQELAVTKYELELEQERSEVLTILLKRLINDESEEVP